jgi:hypothetical protein
MLMMWASALDLRITLLNLAAFVLSILPRGQLLGNSVGTDNLTGVHFGTAALDMAYWR